METFHLFHLAACWKGRNRSNGNIPPPLANEAADSIVVNGNKGVYKPLGDNVASSASVINAASVQIVFASRKSLDFITPEEVQQAERWGGIVCTLDRDDFTLGLTFLYRVYSVP